MSEWSARAPGKVILCGEHAVLYGAPALAVAVNHHVRVGATPSSDGEWVVRMGDLGALRASRGGFAGLAEMVEGRRAEFLAGRMPAHRVLTHPGELVLYALALLAREYRLTPAGGFALHISSTLPPGGGMGSSASAIVAALAALGPALGVELTREQIHPLALRAEHAQHGRSSGLDPYVCLHGGLVRMQQGVAARMDPPPGLGLNLVLTGKPASTTGECVEQVRRDWARHGIWTDFAGIAESFQKSLLASNPTGLKAAIRHNHRLLHTLGVVPAPVAKFVREVEARGGAAKVCGAGAVRGPAAGILLAVLEEGLDELAAASGYTVLRVRADPLGVRNG